MTSEFYKEPEQVVRLWVHECERAFADRMIDQSDLSRFADMRVKATRKFFADIPEACSLPRRDHGLSCALQELAQAMLLKLANTVKYRLILEGQRLIITVYFVWLTCR